MRLDEKVELEYDCYLSGGVVSLVVVKDNVVYCANVGNISACLFFTEKVYSFKFKILELSTDHSAVKYESMKHQYASNLKINENQNFSKLNFIFWKKINFIAKQHNKEKIKSEYFLNSFRENKPKHKISVLSQQ